MVINIIYIYIIYKINLGTRGAKGQAKGQAKGASKLILSHKLIH